MRKFLLFFVLFLVVGCTSSTDLKAYVEADAATFNAISEEYLSLIDSNEKFDESQKERRRTLIETWRLRIENGRKLCK